MNIKEIKLPDLGEGVTEGEIIDIKVSPGEQISIDQILLEVMTDKASMEIPSTIEGQVKELKAQKGSMVSVGEVILTVETKKDFQDLSSEKKAVPEKKEAAPEKTKKAESKTSYSKDSLANDNLAIPATRKLAKELGISLADIPKKTDQITREDLIAYIKSSSQTQAHGAFTSKVTSLDIGNEEELKREPLTGIKRIMFETMTSSKSTIPHFTIIEKANVKHLVKIRSQFKEKLRSKNIGITYLPFFIKAIASRLKEFPVFNSSYDPHKKELVYKKSIHIGIAIDTPQGLIVPVIKDLADKSLLDIIKEIKNIKTKMQDNKIQREDLRGASITLTNIGSIGGISGTPIINPPEVAILGIYRMYPQVVQNSQSQFEEQPFINFSITCDHRFIDGATATRFLKSFVNRIEEPSLIMLD